MMEVMKKLGFNIVLLGMIASGKETQANILSKKYALKFVETGVYSRKVSPCRQCYFRNF